MWATLADCHTSTILYGLRARIRASTWLHRHIVVWHFCLAAFFLSCSFKLSRAFAVLISHGLYSGLWTPNAPKIDHDPGPVQRPDSFIRWISHHSRSKIHFMLNVFHGFCTLPNFAVVRVSIFACTRGNIEIFVQIQTVRWWLILDEVIRPLNYRALRCLSVRIYLEHAFHVELQYRGFA